MRLIDADELLAELEDWKADLYDTSSGRQLGITDAIVIACQMPTIDAEPVRHGKFIGTEYDGYADGYPVYYEWKCSECGCVFEDEEPTYKYCPNCGAKMIGVRNEE